MQPAYITYFFPFFYPKTGNTIYEYCWYSCCLLYTLLYFQSVFLRFSLPFFHFLLFWWIPSDKWYIALHDGRKKKKGKERKTLYFLYSLFPLSWYGGGVLLLCIGFLWFSSPIVLVSLCAWCGPCGCVRECRWMNELGIVDERMNKAEEEKNPDARWIGCFHFSMWWLWWL